MMSHISPLSSGYYQRMLKETQYDNSENSSSKLALETARIADLP